MNSGKVSKTQCPVAHAHKRSIALCKPQARTKFVQGIQTLHKDCSAQATTEYLIVGLILIVLIVALRLLAALVMDGLFTEDAAQSASHALSVATTGSIGDVLLY